MSELVLPRVTVLPDCDASLRVLKTLETIERDQLAAAAARERESAAQPPTDQTAAA